MVLCAGASAPNITAFHFRESKILSASPLGNLQTMVDTFSYSSGLTAREARAMGLQVKMFTGELFCERHSLHLR
jgi:hypothetical protein